jgi:outer membrane receptor protein involved in Fe transport
MLRRRLLASTLLVSGLGLANPALAQDAAGSQSPGTPGTAAPPAEENPPAGVQSQESAGPAEETSSGDIVVTGTLIKNPNLTASSPVTVVGQDEINLRQSNVAEEVLREIPGVAANIGSAVNNGNNGASYVDLRGLGSNRNIVLLDGVRIAPSNFIGRVDLNNIPLALVERVDALTGGASTTYGADAISGVVNFITRNDFAGMELSASNQITQDGDGHFFRGDLTIGANFDDGRGNAVISIGYQESDPVYQGARQISREQIESFSGTRQGSGTGVPSRFSVVGGGTQQLDASGALVPTYASFNFNPFNVFQTPFERFNMYGAGHYEVTDGIEIYARGLFSKNTVSTIVAPSGAFGTSVTVPLSNPFLPEAAALKLCQANIDLDPGAGVTRPTAAQCQAARSVTDPKAPGYLTFNSTLYRRSVELGPRLSDYRTQIFDYRAGVRGAITETINFDLFGAYGESENVQAIQGYLLTSRLRQALLATNPNTCLDPSNGCVPVNIFGPAGSITPKQAAFLTAASTSTNRTSLAQARGLINGDFGVTSPFGADPIGFAVGAEYRKYGAIQTSDLLAQMPGELGGFGGAQPEINGGYDVYEGFAELIAPLVQDRPFFESLTLEAGIRRSRYTVFTPEEPSFNTTTWKVGAQWQPIRDIKFRGNFNRAVRAPNIGELFTPVTTGLTNLAADPCQGAAPLKNANLRAICLAQGAPASSIGTIEAPSAGQINVTGGGNPNVGPEKANTYTVGAVLQPRFIPGLTATVDYYNIKVKGAITNPLPGDLIAACFGADPTNPPAGAATSPACTVIRRNPDTGGLDGDPATTPGLFQPLSNLGRLSTDGIDASLNYRTDLPFADARLSLSFNGNYTFSQKFQATPTSLNRECVGYYSINCSFTGSLQPEYYWTQRTTLTFGVVDVSLLWRHIAPFEQEPDDIENGNGRAFQGNIPGFGEQDLSTIGAYDYFDLSTRFNVTDNFDMTITVQNLFDKDPPLVGNTIGATTFNSGNTYPATYDALGRRFAVGARLKF